MLGPVSGLFDLLALEAEDLREPVDAWVSRARRAAPDVEAPLDAVARTLASHLADATEPSAVREALDALDAGEVWLACACGAGEAAALQLVERRYIAGAVASLQPMHLGQAQRDDVLQAVRQRLLMPTDDGMTRLEGYAGQGRLAALVRVVAVRAALDLVRADRRRPDRVAKHPSDPADALLGEGLSPELQVIRDRHTAAFKAAFQAAVAELPAKNRAVLRLHLIDRLGIDDIAALHGAHRSSAARWLKETREALGKATRQRLRAQLKLSTKELESLYRAVDSQLDLSFARILEEEV